MRVNEPTDAQVEALARALWEAEGEHDSWPEDHGPQWEQDERIDRERCRAMARAALASIGVRELAMEAALANLLDYQANALLQALDGGWGDAIRQCRVALALPPSAAAEAVRGLAECADGGAQTLAQVALWLREHPEIAAEFERDMYPGDSLIQIAARIAKAARPFGEGEA